MNATAHNPLVWRPKTINIHHASPATDEKTANTHTRAFWRSERGNPQGRPVAALGAPEGVFLPMIHEHTTEPPPVGTLDYYREMGKTNPDIAALVGLIDRQGAQLVKALEQLVAEREKMAAATKILTPQAA